MNLPEAALAAIKITSRKIIGLQGLRRGDLEDIRQTMACAVVAAWPTYGPTRGSELNFAWGICWHVAQDILRKRQSSCRQPEQEAWSIEQRLGGDDDALFAGVNRRRGSATQKDLDDLAVDVRQAVVELPDDLRPIAVMLMAGMTRRAIARSLGISVTTLWTRIRGPLLAIFAAAGTHEYLPVT